MFHTPVQAALLIASIFSCRAFSSACKPLPHEPGWPSRETWNALNASVAGQLVAPEPAGAVCHPEEDVYNNTLCNDIQEQWGNPSWHASSPWSVYYNDDTCIPDRSQPCSEAGYPAYVIVAERAEDVQEAVKFASRTGVRLVVKATGHDFLGRSSGAGSLSVWTHLLRGIEIRREDPQAIKYGGVAAVKIAAGMQWGEVYSEAAMHNLTVVGGSDPFVGVGGLVAAGGHSPVSAHYGFPADHVLELEVVTADGEHRIINEDSDSDLFWAMRGGGGSTFAVILSMTVKAFPQLPFVKWNFQLNTTANSDTFWYLTAYFHSQLPYIQEAGGMGYYYILSNVSSLQGQPSNPSADGQLLGTFLFPQHTANEVHQAMNPVLEDIKNSDWSTDPIQGGGIPEEYPSYMAEWSQLDPDAAGISGRLGSWLLDEDGLATDLTTLRKQLQTAADGLPLLGHLVSGPAVRDVQIPGGGNAILPAWRNAYTHVVASRGWPSNNAQAKSLATQQLRETSVPALKALSPNSGAYLNEADPTNPEWKNDYFGENYPRLLEIKRKWDPKGVFWCKPCVGHDDGWEVLDGPEDEDPVEWGVGQIGGRVCRTGG
ncbi:hypothetical protein FQN54_002513 [Arachnomyces sp. PD_36]|nr:hypothetical protein FQN54_002513 [Arachnomyces sp. PD_36]